MTSAIQLSRILAVAPDLGYPSHKTTLIARLAREGAEYSEGPATQGRRGFLYNVATLPQPIRDALTGASAPVSPYQKATGAQKAGADQRLVLARKVRSLIDQGRSVNAACAEVSAGSTVSVSTVKAIWRLVKDAPEADWRNLLVKRYKGREKEPVPEAIWLAFLRDYGRPEEPCARAVYDRVKTQANEESWGAMPSLSTLVRRWNDLPYLDRIAMRKGDRAMQDCLPHAERDRSDFLPMDGWNADFRLFDVNIVFPDGSRGRGGAELVEDEGSNFIPSYALTKSADETENTDLICAAARPGFEQYGLPGHFRFDNTRAAANKQVTGGAKTRFRGKIAPFEIDGALVRLGVTPRFTLPYNGQSKLVERTFADIKERIEKDPRCAGAYVGRSPAHKPANYGERYVPWEVWVIVVAEAIEWHNNRADRRSKVAWGKSFRQVFEEGCVKRVVRLASVEELRRAFLRSERRKVTKQGTFTLGKRPFENRFHCAALYEYARRDVVVRYDPRDLTAPVLVEGLDGRTIAEQVPLVEKRGFNSTEDARAHARAKAQEKRAVTARTKARMAQANAILGTPPTAGSGTVAAAPRVVAPTRFDAQRKAEAEENAKAQAEAERQAREDRQARLRGRQMLRGEEFGRGFSRAG